MQARVNGSSNYNCSKVESALPQNSVGVCKPVYMLERLSILCYAKCISTHMRDNVSSAVNQQERLKIIGWVVGFVDGEGCFCVSINRNSTSRTGWQVIPEFVVTQGQKSLSSLEE